MNIGREQVDGGEGFDAWRDTQVRIVGEGAAVPQSVLMVAWYNAVRENLFTAVNSQKDPDPDLKTRFAVGGHPAGSLGALATRSPTSVGLRTTIAP
jgi:hypothetical protein